MSINFPTLKSYGDVWLDPENNVSYFWDGVKWTSAGSGISIGFVVYSLNNDNGNLIGNSPTNAINAALIAEEYITGIDVLKIGSYLIVLDSTNPDFNVHVKIGQYLYDGLYWIPVPISVSSVFGRTGAIIATEGDYTLTQLGDVSITSPATGSVLKFNGTNWVPGTIAADAISSVFGRTGAVTATEGDYTLTQLGDVNITSPATNSVLKFNGTTWVPGEARNAPSVVQPLTSDEDPVTPTLGFDISGLPVLP